jgi:hypothetical protein
VKFATSLSYYFNELIPVFTEKEEAMGCLGQKLSGKGEALTRVRDCSGKPSPNLWRETQITMGTKLALRLKKQGIDQAKKYANDHETSLSKLIENYLSAITTETIGLALNSEFEDFEDAIQYFSALQNEIGILLTRKLKDYKKAQLSVLTAQDFINL